MHRYLALPIAIIATFGVGVLPVLAQSSDANRTPWGHPDLQGVWSYATLTPLQRAPELEGRAFYSPEEVAAYTQLRKSDRPDRPGVDPGGYNSHWWDGGWVLPDSWLDRTNWDWEGDTLVVETRNYSPSTELRFPSTPKTRAIERFTRTGPDTIAYQFTIEDEGIYAQPWAVDRPMARLDDYVIYEYACHEGNYAMSNILAGEREREQSDAEGGASDAR